MMPLDKVFHKIQDQIKELEPTLELFAEQTIQPAVTDCEKLQQQLNQLQETIAVYKFNKSHKELCPSFNIHAKVSEKIPENISPLIQEHPKEATKEIRQENKEIPAVQEKTNVTSSKRPFSIGINDKFRFINELFAQNSSEYNIVLEQLNSLDSWHETEIYLNSLKSVYQWKENQPVVKYFFSLVKKRFD